MNARTSTSARRRLPFLVAVPVIGALALAGCTAADSDGAAGSSASGAQAAGTGTATAASAAPNAALLAAVDTARDAVGAAGGTGGGAATVLSVEQERNGSAYEVVLVTADGTEHEVHTDATGETVDGTPRTETTDADDRAEDDRFVEAADLSVADAVSAVEDLHAGTITELGLDDHLGAVVWESEVRDTSGTTYSVRLDAGSGEVVSDAVDSDD